LRGQRQRRERILNLDTICVAVLVPRTTHDPSLSQLVGILGLKLGFKPELWHFLWCKNYLELLLKSLELLCMLVTWSSLKILVLQQQGCNAYSQISSLS